MPVADQHRYRHAQHAAQLAERFRQYGGSATEGIASLGINNRNVPVFNHFRQVPDQRDVVGKLALADAAYVAQQPLAPDEAVDRNHVIGTPRVDGLGQHLEIHERIVVAQKHIGPFKVLGAVVMDDGLVREYVREAQEISNGAQVPAGTDWRERHVETGSHENKDTAFLEKTNYSYLCR